MKKKNLYDWVFNYNPYAQQWSAVKREDYQLLFSGRNSNKVLSSSKIETLIELITKTDGTAEGIESFVRGQVKHVIVEG